MRKSVIAHFLLVFAGWWATLPLVEAADAAPEPVALTPFSTVRFATVDQARKMLAARDVFVEALSPFDRQSRLRTDRTVNTDTFLEFVTEQVLAWESPDIQRLSSALESLRARLAAFEPPLPEIVWLIKTTGNEEGGAAYCRGNAIVLPQRMMRRDAAALERLLAHELFHILSRNAGARRAEMYQLVGFDVVPPIDYPPALAARKITNPDAPLADCVMHVRHEDRSISVTPVLFASTDMYDTKKGGAFFDYLQFRLMVVTRSDDHWTALLNEEQPELLRAEAVSDYLHRTGGNTDYIIHPDEILAHNFVHLLFGTLDLKTPALPQQLGKILQRRK